MTDIPETLIITYLEMTHLHDLPTRYSPVEGVSITPMLLPDVEYYRFLYRSVGYIWRWRDRLIMPEDELQAILELPTTHVYVLYEQGVPGGYVELDQQGASVEVAYFGLRQGFFGRGLGKQLLSFGIEQAWNLQPERVWVHTCNLDGPHALDNYVKRGFSVYKVTEQPMPDRYKV